MADDPTRVLRLEYPSTADPRPRWGSGRPSHQGVVELFERRSDAVREALRGLSAHSADLAGFPRSTEDSTSPSWLNEWLIGLDTISLYGFVRNRRPARYVEVGSGQSTRVVRRAIADGGLGTTIRSIDPAPRVEVDELCDEVLRSPLETVDLLGAFGDLEPGDVVFFDGSHRVLPGSDCVVFYVDVLPELPSGVLVGIHDIWLPDDYPPGFFDVWWSEQYLLAAMLLADSGRRYDIVLPCYWATGVPELAAELEPVWEAPSTEGVNRRGSALWLEIR